ncbi:MAG: hypothetical protein DI537_36590 [Stutzerimonas stutzeri]|nr:MAG: hypothetical protein DI537_36590 [Stutzerimonas stutzeri]
MMNLLPTLSTHDLDRELKKPERLRLHPSRGATDAYGIEILWAPFDHIDRNARIVIVGVTPGPTQARRSYDAVRAAAVKGIDPQADLERIKAEASFRGNVIEPNLKSLLEHGGLAESAGIEDIDNLWTKEASKVHFTSTIRYPTFINGKLFNNQIDSLEHPELRKYVETYLAEELASVPTDADIVALGQKGPRIVRHAARAAGIDSRRVVALPHPSGSATGAVRDFLSKNKTRSVRPCRCMLCDRTRIPKGWDLSSRFEMHDLVHGTGSSQRAG